MGYGKHQSFYLKSNWINKGIKAIEEDQSFFFELDNYKRIGIGKNMLISLRYWLEAFNIVTIEFNINAEDKRTRFHKLTQFGKYVRDFDPGCRNTLTKNLLQYYLCLENPLNNNEDDSLLKVEMSNTFYWFFNVSRERIFSKEGTLYDLKNWDQSFGRPTSVNTLNRDIDCLFATYTKNDKAHPEDKNTSILADLGLLRFHGDYYVKTPIDRSNFDSRLIIYIALRMREAGKELSLNSIIESTESVGSIFNLQRIDLIEMIEELISKGEGIKIIRTNNLDTLNLPKSMKSTDYLRKMLGDVNDAIS